LLFDVTSLAYQITYPRKACIIGAGGGRDVVTALATGTRQIDAVEINRAIVELLEGPLAAFSGDIYRRPGVNAIVSEGRSFLTRTRNTYDLIQISLVDSWAATSAGAYALSENYLYTVEALRLYLRRTSPGGVVSISRWSDFIQPFESARLILLAEEALRQESVASPRDHLLFVTGSAVGTLIISKEPLSQAMLHKCDAVAEQRGFVRQWPGRSGKPLVSLVSMVMNHGVQLFAGTGLDLRPPTDDRPFFFQAARLFSLNAETVAALATDMNIQSTSILRLTLIILGIIAVALFFLPFVIFKKPNRSPGFWSASGYFALVGIGFMAVELVWIQKSILFLGHPSYATAVVLASLLFGAGVGSALVSYLSLARARRLLVFLPIIGAVASLTLTPLFRTALAYPLAARVVCASMVFVFAGLFMGLALPLGFITFGDRQKAWFWAVNGASGVLASALSIALAMTFGFVATSLVGVACYVGAVALIMVYAKTNVSKLPSKQHLDGQIKKAASRDKLQ
jgi:hypothetical protein